MVQSSKLVKPLGATVLLLIYTYYSEPRFGNVDGAIIFGIYYLAARAMKNGEERYFALIGYALWTIAYILMMFWTVEKQLSMWPVVTGAYYLVCESFTGFTSFFEPRSKEAYVTPLAVRIGYGVFFFCDVILNVFTILYGSGQETDELGILPMETVSQRVVALCTWLLFWICLLRTSASIMPRETKYCQYAYHAVAHAATMRMPLIAMGPSHQILKLQIFGSAVYVCRFSSPTIPNPANLFRFVMIAMPIACALMSSTLHDSLLEMTQSRFTTTVAEYLALLWISIFVTVSQKNDQHGVIPFSAHQHRDDGKVSEKVQ